MSKVEKSKVQSYAEQFSNQMVRFNPFAIRKTGLIQAQTLLNVNDYMLICAPFQLSMQRAILLVILSADEAGFFQRFRNKLSKISFTFAKTREHEQLNFFVRAKLDRIGPVKGKPNVCLFDLSYTTCPNDMILILGNYITLFAQLRQQFQTFKSRIIDLDDETAGILRFNRFVEMSLGQRKIRPELLSLAVDKLTLAVPEGTAGIQPGAKLVSKLYFQSAQFLVTGTIGQVGGPLNGKLHVDYELDFSADLVEILDDYFYRMSLT